MSDLKVGIAIPNYGRPGYLKQAVESVLAQSYTHFQLVILDDRSPDPAVKAYLSSLKDPRIKWKINDVNLGTAKNYDTAVKLLDPDVSWVVIFDNDDLMDRDYLKILVETHQAYPDARVICGHQVYVDAHGKKIREDEARPEFEDAETYLSLRSRGMRDLRSSNIFFERKKFIEAGGYPQFPSGMGTDTVLIFALAFGNQLAYAPKAVMNIRVHDGAESITTDHLWEKLISMRMMLEYCADVYQRHPDVPAYGQARVFKNLRNFVRIQGSALLIKRYREIMLDRPANQARQEVAKMICECQAQKIPVSMQFSVLAKIFKTTGCDLESTSLYKGLISMKRILRPANIRQALKRMSLLRYVYRHLQMMLWMVQGKYQPLGFKRCDSCDCVSLFYRDTGYAELLNRLIAPWGMSEHFARRTVARENDICVYCRANFRTRMHSRVVLKELGLSSVGQLIAFLKSRPDFVIYEAAQYQLFRRAKIRDRANYIVSEFHPDHPFGESVDGVRNENLECLTFADESIDLVITSEVMEHVSDLPKALNEIHRVLKPGGRNIFTIPVDYGLSQTRTRALIDRRGEVQHVMTPAIHGDDITSGVLAFRDFGTDVVEIMAAHRLECEEEKFLVNGEHVTSVYVGRKT